jgi:cysteine dioxygenase
MANPQVRRELSVHDWLQGIAAIPKADFTRNNVRGYMFHNAIDRKTLEPYLFFSSKRYARNLIFKNDVFECLAMCWDIGQASSIHDHNDKLGWIYLAQGRLFVQNYSIEARDPVRRTCRVVPTNSAQLSANNTAYVDHDEAVHKVSNFAEYQQRAVSVHVYQQPLSQCEVYSLETGTFDVIQLAYTSEYGKLNPAVQL